jgi:hypothetical protein
VGWASDARVSATTLLFLKVDTPSQTPPGRPGLLEVESWCCNGGDLVGERSPGLP